MSKLTNAEQTILAEIQKLELINQKPILIALDGRSGVGKSTIALNIAKEIGAVVIDADKFYSGGKDEDWKSRSTEEKVDKVIDWQRIKKEVLEPLLAGKAATYHPFDFKSWEGLAKESVTLQPQRVIIIDGAYSARPELADLIDLSVLIEVPEDSTRRTRLVSREGTDYMTNWHSIWDPAEDYYFSKICPPESFDLRVTSD